MNTKEKAKANERETSSRMRTNSGKERGSMERPKHKSSTERDTQQRPQWPLRVRESPKGQARFNISASLAAFWMMPS